MKKFQIILHQYIHPEGNATFREKDVMLSTFNQSTSMAGSGQELVMQDYHPLTLTAKIPFGAKRGRKF